jgi:cell division inhibitor SepF
MLSAGVWTNFKTFFGQADDEDFEDELLDDEGRPAIVSLRDAKSARRTVVSVYQPKRYDDVTEIADSLRARHHVVVNLVGADRTLQQRVVDFLSGVVYTMDGKMQRLAESIYLFVPSNVHINSKDVEHAMGGAYDAY